MNTIARLLAATAMLGVGVGAGAFAAPVMAQAGECATAASDCRAADGQAGGAGPPGPPRPIVVTGSRLPRGLDSGPVSAVTVPAGQFTDAGQITIGDRLNELPQLRATFSQANSTRGIGIAGQNLLDLRGLGPARTLVLVNGRRHVSTQANTFDWDVGALPADLIARVDVVTGGSSAIYGSDAVAGVVDFVLRDRFQGVSIRAHSGVSDRGDNAFRLAGALAGTAFAGGRGSIVAAAEYGRQNALFLRDRGRTRRRGQFQLVENTGLQLNPAGGSIRLSAEPAEGNGIPDNRFFEDLRRAGMSEGGSFTAACPNEPAAGESAAAFAQRRTLACSGLANPGSPNPASQLGAIYAFQPDGSLVANGCTTDFRPFLSGNCLGGMGTTFRERGQLEPGLSRFNAALVGQVALTPAIVPFVEAGFSRIVTRHEATPLFAVQAFAVDNPFLTDQARDLLRRLLPPGTTTFVIERQNLDFGIRDERTERETRRIVAGLRGELSPRLRYELTANIGEFRSLLANRGNTVRDRLARALQAVPAPPGYAGAFALDGRGGRVVCAVNADASPGNDDPACVPVNTFGAGQVSPAAQAYFGATARREQRNRQVVLGGFIGGDSAPWFALPGGPASFVLGGEYRVEEQDFAFDPLATSGATSLNAIAPFHPPKYRIGEVFAEVRLPILGQAPLAHELTLEAAGRVADYNLGSTGTAFAWNAGAVYAPVPALRLRGSYQRAVRAPTLGELFTATSTTFNPAFADPCAAQNINANPNRQANCAAAGVPTTQTFTVGGVTTSEPFTNLTVTALAAGTSGNPALREERSSSLTLGATFAPQGIPGLSLSLDYYDIEVRDVSLTLAPQTVLEQCYDSPQGIANPFCALVNRLPNGTFAGQGSVLHAGTPVLLGNPGLSSIGQPFNYARLATRGIDLDLAWRRGFGRAVLDLRGLASYLIARDLYPSLADRTLRDRIKSELGDPAWRLQLLTSLSQGALRLSHRLLYVGRQILALNGAGTYETFFPLDGRPAQNPDVAASPYYPARWYNNARVELDVGSGRAVYFGVDNLFDTRPPLDLVGSEGGSPFDPTGRFIYAGIRTSL